METKRTIVRWEAKGDGEITRYALRTKPKGKGIEIGAYSSWRTSRAEMESEKIALAIERTARDLGYLVDTETTWNDIV